MEKNIKKYYCSSQKHKENEAISYCQCCKVYMCKKCENFHSDLFVNHTSYKIDKDYEEISAFIYCDEKDHSQKLEYYCKNHNKLCCGLCLCKIKDDKNGQHTNCDVCYIKDISYITEFNYPFQLRK